MSHLGEITKINSCMRKSHLALALSFPFLTHKSHSLTLALLFLTHKLLFSLTAATYTWFFAKIGCVEEEELEEKRVKKKRKNSSARVGRVKEEEEE